MAGLTERQPMYLSGRSADVVLSEIRPTKLAPDALRSVNVLLDELLWMILSASRSFATDQLKIGLTRHLPTSLGKEALTEAELELKAYWERTRDAPTRPYVENTQDFPLHPAFELLRLKCEAYSTFNDTDEDTDAEKRWQSKVASASNFSSHNIQFIVPAALYLTAIIEHVCEHLLSNTGRVATRDSSRTTATLQDLFTAMCEDDTIYGLFKNMKVHNQIETQSKALANRPRRSKSFQRSVSDQTFGSQRSNNSPLGSVSTLNGDSKPRVSSESSSSGTAFPQSSSASRASTEKSRAKKLFGRMSMDRDSSSQNGHGDGHKRTASVLSNSGRRPGSVQEDPGTSPSEVEFDELMRSGTTMKVSLTPDRLRTFDVYNKEKGRGMNKLVIPPTFPQQVSSEKLPLQDSAIANMTDESAPSHQRMGSSALKQQQTVPDESGENGDSRTRNQFRGAPPVSYENIPHSRTRSTSTSQTSVSSIGTRHGMSRKGSLSALAIESPHSQSLRAQANGHHASRGSESISKFSDRKIHPSASKDSIDESLDFSSDDEAPVKKQPMGRKRAPTGVSAHTADLIDFLNSGPPPMPKMMGPPLTVSSPTSATSPTDKQKRGRLRSIVSRFKGNQSTDRLSSKSSIEDFHGTLRKSPSLSHPPPSFVPPPLSAKRSLHNISSFSQVQSPYPKPPPPPVPPVIIPLSPPSSPNQAAGGESSLTSPLRPRPSPTVRKAVPAFDHPERSYSNSSIPISETSKPEEVPPPTPSKIETEARKNEGVLENNGALATPLTQMPPKSSLATPPPSQHHIHPPSSSTSSRQGQRRALPPTDTPPTFEEHAKDMRRLLANASTADECRLLVDMFLTRSGLPMRHNEFPPEPESEGFVRQERAVVETLLSNGEPLPMKEIDGEDNSDGRDCIDDLQSMGGRNVEKEKLYAVDGEEAGKRESHGPPTPRSDENYPLFRKTTTTTAAIPPAMHAVAYTVSAEA